MCKRLVAGLVLIVLVVTVCFAVPRGERSVNALTSPTGAAEPPATVIIDAGHGGLTNTIN